jgi:hypothetical protein
MNAQNSIAHPLFIDHMKMAIVMPRKNAIIMQLYGQPSPKYTFRCSHEFNGSLMNS